MQNFCKGHGGGGGRGGIRKTVPALYNPSRYWEMGVKKFAQSERGAKYHCQARNRACKNLCGGWGRGLGGGGGVVCGMRARLA